MKIGSPFNPRGLFVGSFIPNALMTCKAVSSTAKLAWARLAQYAGENGEAYPSQDVLAEQVGVGARQVRRALGDLINAGFLAIKAPTGHARLRHMTNRYVFLWHEIFQEAPQRRRAKKAETPQPQDTNVRSPEDINVRSVVRESVVRSSSQSQASSAVVSSSRARGENDLGVEKPTKTRQPDLSVVVAELAEAVGDVSREHDFRSWWRAGTRRNLTAALRELHERNPGAVRPAARNFVEVWRVKLKDWKRGEVRDPIAATWADWRKHWKLEKSDAAR